MDHKPYISHINQLFESAPAIRIRPEDKWVIFSDLHMGNGSRRDQFLKNAHLFIPTLEKYYLKNGYKLVLNGDVEELHKFSLKAIMKHWTCLYLLFDAFRSRNQFYKIVGNHDRILISEKEYPYHHDLQLTLKLQYNGQSIFIFHGDQASDFYVKYNHFSGMMLKYFANPLGIHSPSVAHNSARQFFIEKRIYQYARRKKIIAIIGHTHRPLFESLSKVDFLKYQIEQLCREYENAEELQRTDIELQIETFKSELEKQTRRHRNKEPSNYVYDANFILPCVFNSGSVAGKRGMTCLEIHDGKIALVHWYDQKKQKKYFKHYTHQPQPLQGTQCFRMILKEDDLAYISNRIKLLA